MKTHRTQAGQSLIEFAVLIPILFFLLMGLFDVGRAVFYYAVMNSAAREGTRFAIVQPDCDYKANPGDCSGGYLEAYPLNCAAAVSTANINICNKISDMLFNVNELSSSTITINQGITGVDAPFISVDIAFLFEPITPGLSLIANLNMHANSQMFRSPIALP